MPSALVAGRDSRTELLTGERVITSPHFLNGNLAEVAETQNFVRTNDGGGSTHSFNLLDEELG